jgi:hypothetical protein
MDHREEQDERASQLTELTCPGCGVSVFTIALPVTPWLWCAQCEGTPKLEAYPPTTAGVGAR